MGLKELAAERIRKLRRLLEIGIDPYKEKRFLPIVYSTEIKSKYAHLKPGDETTDTARVAGRIMSIREHGKIVFADVQDPRGYIQLVFRKDVTEHFDLLELLDRGDFIGAEGVVIRTKKGEISVLVKRFRILSKAIRPLPDTWYGLKDVERRYRERYVDLILNPEVREAFVKIHRMLKEMRNFLDERGFIEVQTPILQPVYGGAFARPFTTHHYALDQTMYLRIAPELYLKRLIVGGFEKVYEFAVCFRNEDIDALHNPEFLQLELYWAYADVNDIMELTEALITHVVERVFGTSRLEFQGKEIDFSRPWRRVRLVDAIKEFGGPDVEKMTEKELRNHAKELGIEEERIGAIIEKLFDYYAKPHLTHPTFVTHFPVDITPLAKRADERYAERFELYIAGFEVANAYTELNNPIEQYKRFKEEEELRKRVRKEGFEFMPMDKDYIRALEYGMPPTGGLGIGIGRLAMVLLNKPTLKEVILFPALSREENIELVVEMFPEVFEWYQ